MSMECQNLFYTHYKGKDGESSMDKRPYYVEGEGLRYDGDAPTSVVFYAKDAKTNDIIGLSYVCRSDDNRSADLNLIKLRNHAYDHCGVATTLLNVAENFALQKLHANTMYLVCSPEQGYEEIVPNFYSRSGYLSFSALAMWQKRLSSETVKTKIDFDTISITQADSIQRDQIREFIDESLSKM